MAFTVASTFVPGATTLLFDIAPYAVNQANRRVAVSDDGRRFLLLKNATTAAGGGTAPRLLFVENWFEELKQRVPIP